MDTYVWRPTPRDPGQAATGLPSCSSGTATAHMPFKARSAALPLPPPAGAAGVPLESGSQAVTLAREASLAADAAARLQPYLSFKGSLTPDAQTAGA